GDVGRVDVLEYLAALAKKGLTGVARARKVSAIREYFRYLEGVGVVQKSPTAGIDTPKREKHTRQGDVSQVLIPDQKSYPNSYRLMKSPITRSCMRSVLEKQIVRRTSRLIRVRRLICLLSIFCVFSLPT